MPFLAENNVLQLYENKNTNQSIWTLGFSDWKDFFTKDGGVVNGDGITTSVTAGGDKIRMNVTSIPVSNIMEDGNGNFNKGLDNAVRDLALALDRGFLYSSKDFRNIEVT